jgi:hypothetical protein
MASCPSEPSGKQHHVIHDGRRCGVQRKYLSFHARWQYKSTGAIPSQTKPSVRLILGIFARVCQAGAD